MGSEGKHISEAEMHGYREADRRHDELVEECRRLKEALDRVFRPGEPDDAPKNATDWCAERTLGVSEWYSPYNPSASKRRAHLMALDAARLLCAQFNVRLCSGDPWLQTKGEPLAYEKLSYAAAVLAADHLKGRGFKVDISEPTPGSDVGHTLFIHDPFLDIGL